MVLPEPTLNMRGSVAPSPVLVESIAWPARAPVRGTACHSAVGTTRTPPPTADMENWGAGIARSPLIDEPLKMVSPESSDAMEPLKCT